MRNVARGVRQVMIRCTRNWGTPLLVDDGSMVGLTG